MAQLPYTNLVSPAFEPLVERIVAERGSLLHLYQMLLHSPLLTEGWLTVFTNLRQRLGLPGALSELVIMRVALLNRAPYEAEQHAPIALKEGLNRSKLDTLADWEHSDAFDARQRAALALTDTMTREVQVPPPVLDEVRRHLDDREVVELVATIAAYNMVSRVLEALQIHSHDERPALRIGDRPADPAR